MERVSVQRESWRRTPWKTGAKQRKKQRGGKRVGAAGTSRKAAVGHFDSGRRFPSCEDDSARSHQAEPIGGRNGGQPYGCRPARPSALCCHLRSEERRGGKECCRTGRSRSAPYH